MLHRSIVRQRVAALPASAAHLRTLPRCQRLRLCVTAAAGGGQDKTLHTRVAIIGGGPAAHTAAIYAARAELEPVLFEGWMAGGLPPGGQLTTTTYVENFPGFVEPILGIDLTDKFRAHSVRYGTRVFTETVTSLDLHVGKDKGQQQGEQQQGGHGQEAGGQHRPFVLYTPERTVTADTVIISTGASAKRLTFPGSGEESEGGFWNRGISACAVCDGTSPLIRNKPVAVVGGGDSAMEEAMYLTRYASKVYLVHRFDYFEASKAMARRALSNPKIEVLWRSEVKEAHGNEQGNLGSITVARRGADGQVSHSRVEVGGLFFAIGHRAATDFLDGQLELDPFGHIVTVPGTTVTSVPGAPPPTPRVLTRGASPGVDSMSSMRQVLPVSRSFYKYEDEVPDPGTAAVEAGHAAIVLPWLVSHSCPLDPDKTLEAAAQHCDLAGLQAAWELLGYSVAAQGYGYADSYFVLAKAAGQSGGVSGGNPAIAKLTWLLSVTPAAVLHNRRPQLLAWAAVGATSSGSLPLLAWLRGQGLELPSTCFRGAQFIFWLLATEGRPAWAMVLAAALRVGHVAMADWLVDEAGCPLPSGEIQEAVGQVWRAAAEGGHVESLQWLLGRGVPAYKQYARQAASAGRMEALRFMRTECGVALTKDLFMEAVSSHSMPTAAWLLQAGCPMDPEAYHRAARAGDADMVAWLAQEAGCPWDQGTIAAVLIHWPRTPWAARRGLQRAVSALEEAGCPPLRVALESGLGMGEELEHVLDSAAMHGDLWLLRRLHGELGMGLGRRTLAAAAEGGCEAVLEWLVGAGCELVGSSEYDPYVRACGNGDLCTPECLVRLGLGFSPQVVRVAARSFGVRMPLQLPVLRWLVERGAPWDKKTAEEVAFPAKSMGKYGDSVAWLEARLGRAVRWVG